MKRVEADFEFDCSVRTSALLIKDEGGDDIDKEILVGVNINGVYIDWTDFSRDARKRIVDMVEKNSAMEDYE